MDKFLDAIRYEIARSAEKAYQSLKVADLYKLFMIQSEAELKAFVAANSGKEGINWTVQGDRLHFVRQHAD